MAARALRLGTVVRDALGAGIEKIEGEVGVRPEFPAAVEAAAVAASTAPRLPELDRTDIALVTIDPTGAMDLDQALHLERSGDGYVVHYAIADLPAFIEAGDPVDEEARRRGESMYGADTKIPLHPVALSEDAASLFPDRDRPAYLWTLELDASGEVTAAKVERAMVRSREQLDYETAQRRIEDGEEMLALLKTVGELRIAKEAERGGVSLPMPEQQVAIEGDRWRLEFRELIPAENWNAQISLMTGFAAAAMMVEAKVGVLRTLPPPPEHATKRLRRTAKALGLDWPTQIDYPEYIRGLDPSVPAQAAMVVACTSILRGAGYAVLNGALPEHTEHSALAANYAHVTAPLRRLVDRYGLEICVALSAGQQPPEWAVAGLDGLPEIMQESGRKANAYENAVLNLVEATILAGHVGETFEGCILEADHKEPGKGDLMIREPAVEASVTAAQGEVPVGEAVTVTLAEADPASRMVRFTLP